MDNSPHGREMVVSDAWAPRWGNADEHWNIETSAGGDDGPIFGVRFHSHGQLGVFPGMRVPLCDLRLEAAIYASGMKNLGLRTLILPEHGKHIDHVMMISLVPNEEMAQHDAHLERERQSQEQEYVRRVLES